MSSPVLSVCATSFNCADAVREHIDSVWKSLGGISFEYVIVDNRSSDGTMEILLELERSHEGLAVLSRRCSRGRGRQVAAEHASADTLLVVDVDTIYGPPLRSLVWRYLEEFRARRLALQGIYAGLYPRDLWFEVGGMRDLNFAEDFDLWMRLWEHGFMRWTPVVLGENRKLPSEQDGRDVLSRRYAPPTRVLRLFRRELDFWRLRRYSRLDLVEIWRANAVDLGLGEMRTRWFGEQPAWSLAGMLRRVRADLRAIFGDGR